MKPILPLCVCRDSLCKIPYGCCHCGCGDATPIQKNDVPCRGYVAGMPSKYCLGHKAKPIRPEIEQPSDLSIRHIALTRGQYAIVSSSDYDWLMRWRWHSHFDPKVGGYYAMRRLRKSESGGRAEARIGMHVAIFKPEPGYDVDHRNRKTLDNRRRNLRQATPTDNSHNQKLRKHSTTGVAGVSRVKIRGKLGKYLARIVVNGNRITIGRFELLEDAARARREAEVLYFGEFAPD